MNATWSVFYLKYFICNHNTQNNWTRGAFCMHCMVLRVNKKPFYAGKAFTEIHPWGINMDHKEIESQIFQVSSHWRRRMALVIPGQGGFGSRYEGRHRRLWRVKGCRQALGFWCVHLVEDYNDKRKSTWEFTTHQAEGGLSCLERFVAGIPGQVGDAGLCCHYLANIKSWRRKHSIRLVTDHSIVVSLLLKSFHSLLQWWLLFSHDLGLTSTSTNGSCINLWRNISCRKLKTLNHLCTSLLAQSSVAFQGNNEEGEGT